VQAGERAGLVGLTFEVADVCSAPARLREAGLAVTEVPGGVVVEALRTVLALR